MHVVLYVEIHYCRFSAFIVPQSSSVDNEPHVTWEGFFFTCYESLRTSQTCCIIYNSSIQEIWVYFFLSLCTWQCWSIQTQSIVLSSSLRSNQVFGHPLMSCYLYKNRFLLSNREKYYPFRPQGEKIISTLALWWVAIRVLQRTLMLLGLSKPQKTGVVTLHLCFCLISVVFHFSLSVNTSPFPLSLFLLLSISLSLPTRISFTLMSVGQLGVDGKAFFSLPFQIGKIQE